MTDLVTIRSKGGSPFTVSREHAPRFQALIDDLEAAGYAIDPKQSGGYNPRNIAGTNTPSQHSFGTAIDINWSDNPRGAAGKMPANVAQDLAAKHGFTWGGAWSNPDPMHFEVARGGQVPIAQRGIASFAGLPKPAEQPPDGMDAATYGVAPQRPAGAPVIAGQQSPGQTPERPAASPLDFLDENKRMALVRSALGLPAAAEGEQRPADATQKTRSPIPELDMNPAAIPMMQPRRVDLSRLRAALEARRAGRA